MTDEDAHRVADLSVAAMRANEQYFAYRHDAPQSELNRVIRERNDAWDAWADAVRKVMNETLPPEKRPAAEV